MTRSKRELSWQLDGLDSELGVNSSEQDGFNDEQDDELEG